MIIIGKICYAFNNLKINSNNNTLSKLEQNYQMVLF